MLAAKHPPPLSTNSFWVPSSPPGHPRAYQPCAAESMSDASVGLPPFAHFGGTVQQQIRQAITWRQQKLQASSSSSSLQQASLAPLPAVPVPQLPSAAQPTTPHHPHHHQPPPPFINRPTPCRPPTSPTLPGSSRFEAPGPSLATTEPSPSPIPPTARSAPAQHLLSIIN